MGQQAKTGRGHGHLLYGEFGHAYQFVGIGVSAQDGVGAHGVAGVRVVVVVALGGAVVWLGVGQMGEDAEHGDAGHRLRHAIVQGDLVEGIAWVAGSHAGDEAHAQRIGPQLHVEISVSGSAVAVVVAQGPRLQQWEGVGAALAERTPADPIGDVQPRRYVIRVGFGAGDEGVAIPQNVIANLGTDGGVGGRPGRPQVGPVGALVVVLPLVPAPDVGVVRPPSLEIVPVGGFAGGAIELGRGPQAVVFVIVVVVLAGAVPRWIVEAAGRRGLRMGLQESPRQFRPAQVVRGECRVEGPPEPRRRREDRRCQRCVVGGALEEVAGGALVLRHAVEPAFGGELVVDAAVVGLDSGDPVQLPASLVQQVGHAVAAFRDVPGTIAELTRGDVVGGEQIPEGSGRGGHVLAVVPGVVPTAVGIDHVAWGFAMVQRRVGKGIVKRSVDLAAVGVVFVGDGTDEARVRIGCGDGGAAALVVETARRGGGHLVQHVFADGEGIGKAQTGHVGAVSAGRGEGAEIESVEVAAGQVPVGRTQGEGHGEHSRPALRVLDGDIRRRVGQAQGAVGQGEEPVKIAGSQGGLCAPGGARAADQGPAIPHAPEPAAVLAGQGPQRGSGAAILGREGVATETGLVPEQAAIAPDPDVTPGIPGGGPQGGGAAGRVGVHVPMAVPMLQHGAVGTHCPQPVVVGAAHRVQVLARGMFVGMPGAAIPVQDGAPIAHGPRLVAGPGPDPAQGAGDSRGDGHPTAALQNRTQMNADERRFLYFFICRGAPIVA